MRNERKSLRELRKARGITLKQASDSTGVSVSHLGAAETGKRRLVDPVLQSAIAEFYSVPVEYIVEFDPGAQENSSLREESAPYATRGFDAIRTETMEKLIDVCRAERDWMAMETIAAELKRREGAE